MLICNLWVWCNQKKAPLIWNLKLFLLKENSALHRTQKWRNKISSSLFPLIFLWNASDFMQYTRLNWIEFTFLALKPDNLFFYLMQTPRFDNSVTYTDIRISSLEIWTLTRYPWIKNSRIEECPHQNVRHYSGPGSCSAIVYSSRELTP